MDWIEKLLGMSPDGGDGTAETAIVLALAIVVAALIILRTPVIRQAMRKYWLGSRSHQR
jgi:hypothetical protein